MRERLLELFRQGCSPAQVRLFPEPPFKPNRATKGRKAQGNRYERKVHDHFLSLYSLEKYIPSPWFRVDFAREHHWIQPDGLFFPDDRNLVIVEVKYQHTPDCIEQLEGMYRPALQSFFPAHRISLAEVVKWYDPSTSFPRPHRLVERLEWFDPTRISVHIYNPR